MIFLSWTHMLRHIFWAQVFFGVSILCFLPEIWQRSLTNKVYFEFLWDIFAMTTFKNMALRLRFLLGRGNRLSRHLKRKRYDSWVPPLKFPHLCYLTIRFQPEPEHYPLTPRWHVTSPLFTLPGHNAAGVLRQELYLKTVEMFGWLNPFKLNGWHPREAYQKWLKRVEDSVCVWMCQDESAQATRPAPRARELISISAHSNLPSPEHWS